MDQDFRDAVVSIIDQYMRDNIHTSAPAKVGNVSENFTAELTPDLKVTTDVDREVPYPKISGTAILMPTGAGGTIGFAFPEFLLLKFFCHPESQALKGHRI